VHAPSPQVHAPPQAPAPPLCVRALGSFKPLRAHICPLGAHLCSLGLNYAPWDSIMPFGALLCPLGLKCVPPLKHSSPPSCMHAPPRRANSPPSLPCVPLRCHSRPHLCRLCPLDLLKVLPWKSTSPLPLPQPTILTGGKCKNESGHAILFLHEHVW
jgi:hypothetical protein